MFEIPDDDDFFREDALLDIISTNCDKAVRLPDTEVKLPQKCSLRNPHSAEIAKDGSPQAKKKRILSDVSVKVNCSNTESTSGIALTPYNPQQFCGVADNNPEFNSENKQNNNPVIHDCKSLSEADNVKTKRSLRRFPGPAGILPLVKPEELTAGTYRCSGLDEEQNTKKSSSPKKEMSTSQPSSEDIFGTNAWQYLIADLAPDADDVLKKFSIKVMLYKARHRLLPKGKVPLLLGVIDSLDFHGIDVGVVVCDPTGQVQGTLHRDVLRDFGADMQVGAAIVLRQVSIISPSVRTHYLNITTANVVAIYPAQNSKERTTLPASIPQYSSLHCAQDMLKNCVRTAEVELLEGTNCRRENLLSSSGDFSPGLQINTSECSSELKMLTPKTHVVPETYRVISGTPRHLLQNSHSVSLAPHKHAETSCMYSRNSFTFVNPNISKAMASATQSTSTAANTCALNNTSNNYKHALSGSTKPVSVSNMPCTGKTSVSIIQNSQGKMASPFHNGIIGIQNNAVQSGLTCPNNFKHFSLNLQNATPHSNWSFRHNQTTPPVTLQPPDVLCGASKGGRESPYSGLYVLAQLQAQSSENSLERDKLTLSAVTNTSCQTVNDQKPFGLCGMSAEKSKTLWSDELSDEILSQLSEDF